jgi:hypothetical protein
VRAVSWCAPWHWGQTGRNLLERTYGSLGVGLHGSPAALWHRSTSKLNLDSHWSSHPCSFHRLCNLCWFILLHLGYSRFVNCFA